MSEGLAVLEYVFGILESARPGEFDAEPPIEGLTLECIRTLPEAEQKRLGLELLHWGAQHQIQEPFDAPVMRRGDFRL